MAKPIRTLKRTGRKGQFVKYPSDWDRRMVHTGNRRFDTSCDLVLGLCACGDRHSEEDGWVQQMLSRYNCRIESHAEWLARSREAADPSLKG